LDSNQISDISPLVDNPGIETDDDVDITNNQLDCEDPDTLEAIQTLEDRGVLLEHDCRFFGDADLI
jgi:hypothetical protein